MQKAIEKLEIKRKMGGQVRPSSEATDVYVKSAKYVLAFCGLSHSLI